MPQMLATLGALVERSLGFQLTTPIMSPFLLFFTPNHSLCGSGWGSRNRLWTLDTFLWLSAHQKGLKVPGSHSRVKSVSVGQLKSKNIPSDTDAWHMEHRTWQATLDEADTHPCLGFLPAPSLRLLPLPATAPPALFSASPSPNPSVKVGTILAARVPVALIFEACCRQVRGRRSMNPRLSTPTTPLVKPVCSWGKGLGRQGKGKDYFDLQVEAQ